MYQCLHARLLSEVLWVQIILGNTDLAKVKQIYLESAVVQSLSHVQLFATPWTAACQASLYFTISQSLFKFHVH